MPTESQHQSHNDTYDDFIFVTKQDPAADCSIIAAHHWTAVIEVERRQDVRAKSRRWGPRVGRWGPNSKLRRIR